MLFSILVGKSTDYDVDDEFLDGLRRELERRDLSLEAVRGQFEVRFNGEPVEIESHEQAGRLLDREMAVGDVWTLTNYLQEQLTVQKGSDFWIIRYDDYEDIEVESFTFGMEDTEKVKTVLSNFLALEDWEPSEDDQFTFEDWEAVLNTTSRFYARGWSEKLKEAEIPFLVRAVPVASSDPLFVASPVQERRLLLIPGDYLDDYNELVADLDRKKKELLAQIESLEKADDLEGQLAVYRQLDQLTLVDAYIFYNKGCVLFDLGRFDEAAEAVILSINLDLDLGQLSRAHESVAFLEEILAETPKNIDILLILADVEAQRDNLDAARSYYQRILGIDENNAGAHLNLGYLYFESDEMHSLAMKHFNRFLDVAESEEEKQVVKELLSQMG